MDAYAASMEEENATLRATISSLQTKITKSDAIIGDQKELLNERNLEAIQKIAQLEVDKAKLLAAATPIVYTPQTDPPLDNAYSAPSPPPGTQAQ